MVSHSIEHFTRQTYKYLTLALVAVVMLVEVVEIVVVVEGVVFDATCAAAATP